MRSRNWGRIVFVSSESALQIPTEMIHYGMTKTAQLAVSRGLAETLVGTGVTVNSVLPGPTASEGVGEFVAQIGHGARLRRRYGRTRIFRGRSSLLGATAIRDPRRGGGNDHVRLQRPSVGDDGSGAPGRRRRGAGDRVKRGFAQPPFR